MAMQRCVECDTPVSTQAATCPSCGRRRPTGGFSRPVKIGFGLMLFFASLAALRDVLMAGLGTTSLAPAPLAEPYRPTTTAVELARRYHANEIEADQAFRGRPLRVTGVIESLSKTFFDDGMIGLAGDVRATLQTSALGEAAKLSKGQTVTLACVGGGMTLGSPNLQDCVIDALPVSVPASPQARAADDSPSCLTQVASAPAAYNDLTQPASLGGAYQWIDGASAAAMDVEVVNDTTLHVTVNACWRDHIGEYDGVFTLHGRIATERMESEPDTQSEPLVISFIERGARVIGRFNPSDFGMNVTANGTYLKLANAG